MQKYVRLYNNIIKLHLNLNYKTCFKFPVLSLKGVDKMLRFNGLSFEPDDYKDLAWLSRFFLPFTLMQHLK